jgi:NADH-quinone oxidoreductase subunit E
MLTDEERREIEEEIAHYPFRRAACVEALKVVQGHRGWVPDEQITDLAPLLEMTPDELDAVATFYSFIFRRPVGKHVILVCDSVSCWVMGCETVARHLMERLGIAFGETTPDGLFTLLPAACLGECDHAPAIMIGERVYVDVKPEDIETILREYER